MWVMYCSRRESDGRVFNGFGRARVGAPDGGSDVGFRINVVGTNDSRTACCHAGRTMRASTPTIRFWQQASLDVLARLAA